MDTQEVTLKQWCEKLPEFHKVNKELAIIKESLIAMNSMVTSGRSHDERSREKYYEAMDILD